VRNISKFYNEYLAVVGGADALGTLSSSDFALAEYANISDAGVYYAASSHATTMQVINRLRAIILQIDTQPNAKAARSGPCPTSGRGPPIRAGIHANGSAKLKQLLLSVAAITALGLSTPARAQGVPTFDGSQLGQLVAQLEHMAEDLNVQLQQLATMRLELETQLSQLLNLEAQLTSLIEGSGLRIERSLRIDRRIPSLAGQAGRAAEYRSSFG